MFKALAIGAACLTLWSGPALAATLVDTTGTPLDEKIQNNAAPDGTTLTLKSSPGNYLIDYSSTDTLHAAGNDGQGFAQVSGPFTDLTIDPQAPLAGFSALKFRVDPAKENQTDFTFDLQVNFLSGPSEFFLSNVLQADNRFLLTAGANQVISSVKFYNLLGTPSGNKNESDPASFDFDSIRQVSFNVASAVPEPSTWGLLITGFGLTGMVLRRSRRTPSAIRARSA